MNNSELLLSFEFDTDWMISTNDMYIHKPKKTKNGRLTAYTTKSNALRDFQCMMSNILESLITNEYINNLILFINNNPWYALKITTKYYMPLYNYENSDVSNYIKAYEDCISTRLKNGHKKHHVLDDKNNLEYHSIKQLNIKDVSKWHISTVIEVIKRDNNYLILKGWENK